jgi:hypothetical protein
MPPLGAYRQILSEYAFDFRKQARVEPTDFWLLPQAVNPDMAASNFPAKFLIHDGYPTVGA